MKTSELIEMLQDKLNKHGDLEMLVNSGEESTKKYGSAIECGAVITLHESDNTPLYNVLMSFQSANEMGTDFDDERR